MILKKRVGAVLDRLVDCSLKICLSVAFILY